MSIFRWRFLCMYTLKYLSISTKSIRPISNIILIKGEEPSFSQKKAPLVFHSIEFYSCLIFHCKGKCYFLNLQIFRAFFFKKHKINYEKPQKVNHTFTQFIQIIKNRLRISFNEHSFNLIFKLHSKSASIFNKDKHILDFFIYLI